MKKAIVSLSGGVDSLTCLAIAVNELGKDNVSTVSIYYGQKHNKELECAKKIADYYNVSHKIIDLSKTGIMDDSNCPLLQQSTEAIPEQSYAKQIEENGEGMVTTYVPFRNGLFMASLAAYAMSKYPNDEVDLYIGAHADDAAGQAYADCSPEFTNTIGKAINIGTYGKVNIKAPLVTFNKAQVVKTGLELKAPYELSWSCYSGGDKPCGKCATCIDRAEAFRLNGISDPALS